MINEIRKKVIDALNDKIGFRVCVVAVLLPNGAIEIITNHGKDQVKEKLKYYAKAYDDAMRLRTNTNIMIVDIMIV